MKHSAYSRSSLSVLSLLIGTLTLVGCGGAFNMPDSVVSSQAAGPPIAGSVYGGHAPIVGSHVYLLQPGTGGYGTIATSILGNNGATTASNGFILSTNPATGGDPYIPSGWKYVTSDNNGNFYLSGAYNCTAGYPVYIYSSGGNATGSALSNTGIVQLAILGNCPSTGQTNFGNGSSDQLNYVYSNEVSTVAAAYVFQPFTVQGTATTASAIYVGTSGTTQALLGIQNAASTAAQLYSIQGNGQISTSGDGEGHVANSRTILQSIVGGVIVTTPNAGNGIVPEATINTLANILADCVDSTGGTATQCTTLFTNATETGDSAGVKPTDIARAAMNIARYPAGNYSTANTPTNFVANIFALGNGTVPYVPKLSAAPNDFTIAINYPYAPVGGYTTSNNDVYRAESIEVDQLGQIWITAQGNIGAGLDATADRWSPLGVLNATPNSKNYIFGYVSIDGSNNAWTGNANSTTGIFEAGGNGAFTTTYGAGYTTAYTVVADKTGDAYFFASNASNPNNTYDTFTYSEMWEYNATGTLVSGSAACNGTTRAFVYNCISQTTGGGRTSIFTAGDFVAHGAIDASGDFWLTSEDSEQIAKVTPTGTQVWQINTGVKQPEFPSIDHAGNGWIANQAAAGTIYKITTGGISTTLTSASTGADLTWTFGSAVDGNGNVWFANRCGNYGTCGGGAGINTIVEINGTNNFAISPTTNYVPETEYPSAPTTYTKMLDDSLNLAVDPSGDLWITNYIGNSVVEIIGTAAPVVTPLSLAAGNNVLGTKP
jgi:hypothetical protein